tara:strand:+ start:272 stop:451 length:180 start_codon:yes stop_codon:yes gene_type:complete
MTVEYKKWNIDHVYDVSEGYEEIDHFVVWTPDRLDMVAEEFATIEQAKEWVDQHLKEVK